MFSAVCNANSTDLRQKVVDHLEANAALHHDFLKSTAQHLGTMPSE